MASVLSVEHRRQLHEELDRVLDAMPTQLEDAETAEVDLRNAMRRLSNKTMQAWANAADRNTVDTTCACCGEAMRHRGNVACWIETLHGRVHFRRPRRRCERCQIEVYPHDRSLRFGEHGVSWQLARWIVHRAAEVTYETVRDQLQEDYGTTLSKHTLEQIVHHAGQRALPADDSEREGYFALSPAEQARQLPQSVETPEVVTVYADATKLHSNGAWRDIRVGRVMTFDKQERRLAQKTFARFLSVEEFGRRLFLEATSVGYGNARRKAFLGDGAHWIWEIAALLFPDAVPILDWYHLSEHVHDCAKEVFGEGSDEARAWAKTRLGELWEGQNRTTRAEIVSLRKTLRSQTKREALRKLGVYLKNNQHRTNYPQYRAEGLPVGSGPIESTCKLLVGQRCKLSGMRSWTDHGSESILHFRAAKHDGRFDDTWSTHVRHAA